MVSRPRARQMTSDERNISDLRREGRGWGGAEGVNEQEHPIASRRHKIKTSFFVERIDV